MNVTSKTYNISLWNVVTRNIQYHSMKILSACTVQCLSKCTLQYIPTHNYLTCYIARLRFNCSSIQAEAKRQRWARWRRGIRPGYRVSLVASASNMFELMSPSPGLNITFPLASAPLSRSRTERPITAQCNPASQSGSLEAACGGWCGCCCF